MKYAKYIIATIFYAIALVIMISNSNNASLPGTAVIGFQPSDEIVLDDLFQLAKEDNVILYTYDTQRISLEDYCFTYYTAADEQKAVQKTLGIRDGVVRNLLTNEERIIFKTFSELTPSITRNLYMWYLIGDSGSCSSFSVHVKNRLHCHVDYRAGEIDYTAYMPFAIFGILLLLLLIYCYIDASMQKKEIAIRVIHGESPLYHYLKTVLTDSAVFAVIFLTGWLIQKKYTMLYRPCADVYWLLIPFFVFLWIANLHLLRISPKEIVFGHQRSAKLLILMSVLSTVAAVTTCLFITLTIPLLSSVRHYKEGKPFFEAHSDYYFVGIWSEVYDQMQDMNDPNKTYLFDQRKFLKETDAELHPILMMLESDYAMSSQPLWQMIYSNHYALPYYHSVIPESEQVDLEQNDAAFLVPSNLPATERQKAIQFLLQEFETYEGYRPDKTHTQIIEFQPKTKIIFFQNDIKTHFGFADLPVICIASDTYSRPDADRLNINHVFYFQNETMIFKSPDPERIKELHQNLRGTPILSNALELYLHDYHLQASYLIISIIMIILITVFYIAVLYTILRLDYQMNAMELAIRKTLGDSIYQKNHRQFEMVEIMFIIDLVLSCLAVHLTHRSTYLTAIIVSAAMLLISYMLLFCIIRRIERQKITRILKGGAL